MQGLEDVMKITASLVTLLALLGGCLSRRAPAVISNATYDGTPLVVDAPMQAWQYSFGGLYEDTPIHVAVALDGSLPTQLYINDTCAPQETWQRFEELYRYGKINLTPAHAVHSSIPTTHRAEFTISSE